MGSFLPEIKSSNKDAHMRIRVTAVAEKAVIDLILSRDFTVNLEDSLKPVFESYTFGDGVDSFMIVLVAVEADSEKNQRFVDEQHHMFRYKHPLTKEWVRCLSVSVPMNPEEVLEMDKDTLKKEFIRILYSRLENPEGLKIPKKFDYQSFLAYLKDVLPSQ